MQPREIRRFIPEPSPFESAWERGLRYAKEVSLCIDIFNYNELLISHFLFLLLVNHGIVTFRSLLRSSIQMEANPPTDNPDIIHLHGLFPR